MSRTWMITGAGRGIGAEIVTAALAAGDQVVATSRNIGRLEMAYPGHPKVLVLRLDVTVEAQAHAAVAVAMERFGRIDVLVNNAGYGQLGAFEENMPEDAQQQFDTNVFGLLHVTRAVLPVMRRQRSGRIFNLSSVGGAVGFGGAALYCATKFAVEGFTESLAPEVAPFGIHLTVVEPGFFRTEFLEPDSVRYGDGEIEDYASLRGMTRGRYEDANGQQGGDPARLATALVTLAGVAEPPMRFAAGADAVGLIETKLARWASELATWRDLSASTAFEPVTA